MEQPSWMAEPCPAWCVRDHGEDDHPDDRRHQGRPVEVHVVVASEAIPAASGTPATLVVQLDQPVGTRRAWVRIEASEAAEPRFAVRACDAVPLVSAILAAVTP
jgi:hypothetical protein